SGELKENRLPMVPLDYGDDSFKPWSFREKPQLFRAVVVFGIVSVLLFNAISVRFLTDFFPAVFAVHGWTTTFLVATTVTAVNYLFGRLMYLLQKESYCEWSLALDWLA